MTVGNSTFKIGITLDPEIADIGSSSDSWGILLNGGLVHQSKLKEDFCT